MFGGKKAKKVNKTSKGLVSSVYNPLERVVKGAEGVFGSAANTMYNVPATLAKGAKNTMKTSVVRLTKGLRNIGRKSASTINDAATHAFSGKSSRKNRNNRVTRKNHRSQRKADDTVLGFLGGFLNL